MPPIAITGWNTIAKRQHKTSAQDPPAHAPQADGEAERAVQEVKAQLRTMRLRLEARIGASIHVDARVLERIILHAANSILPPLPQELRWQDVRVRRAGAGQAEEAEQGHEECSTLDARFQEATWVGYNGRTGEHIVVSPGGGSAIQNLRVPGLPDALQVLPRDQLVRSPCLCRPEVSWRRRPPRCCRSARRRRRSSPAAPCGSSRPAVTLGNRTCRANGSPSAPHSPRA